MRPLTSKFFFSRDDRPDHFKALDGLRGIAVLLVMFSHSSNIQVWFHHTLNFTETGKLGVYLFFLLSAYLLDRQIVIALQEGRADLRYWMNYLLRRFMRIFPLFFLALLFNYALYSNGSPYPIHIVDWQDIFDHLMLQKGKRVFWSIPVEFIYYFISPVLLFLIGKLTNWKPLLYTVATFFLIVVIGFFTQPLELSNINTIKYLPIFLIGTLLSVTEVMGNAFASMKGTDQRNWNRLAWLSFLVIILTFRVIAREFYGSNYPFHEQEYYLLYAMLWGIMLVIAKHSASSWNRFLCWKPLRFIGVISFSAYLFHIPILNFCAESGVFPHKLRMVFFVLLTVLFSTVTYLLVERPLSKVKLKL